MNLLTEVSLSDILFVTIDLILTLILIGLIRVSSRNTILNQFYTLAIIVFSASILTGFLAGQVGLGLLFLLVPILFILCLWMVNYSERRLYKPLQLVAHQLRQLLKGNLEVSFDSTNPSQSGKDEVSTIISLLNEHKIDLKKKTELPLQNRKRGRH